MDIICWKDKDFFGKKISYMIPKYRNWERFLLPFAGATHMTNDWSAPDHTFVYLFF